MAEGVEEAESNSTSGSSDAPTSIISAAMPCDARDFEFYHYQIIRRSKSISPPVTTTTATTTTHQQQNANNRSQRLNHDKNFDKDPTDYSQMSDYFPHHRSKQPKLTITNKSVRSETEGANDSDHLGKTQNDDDEKQLQTSSASLAQPRLIKTEVS